MAKYYAKIEKGHKLMPFKESCVTNRGFRCEFFLFQDPVINVRLKFCSVLPSLKSVLKLPSNRALLQQLEQCVRRLVTSEQEPDVSVAIREVRLYIQENVAQQSRFLTLY